MSLIIPRADWSPRYGTGPQGPVPRSRVIVHHFAVPDIGVVPREEERRILRNVEDYHARTFWTAENRHRARLGYNLVVFDSGRVYEGCGLTTVGAHTAGHNTAGFGLAFPINGDRRGPTEAAWEAAASAVAELQDRGILAPRLTIEGHRDHAAKSCPGDRVYPHVSRLLEADVPLSQEDIDRVALATTLELLRYPAGSSVENIPVLSVLTRAYRSAQQSAALLRDHHDRDQLKADVAAAVREALKDSPRADADQIVDKIAERLAGA